MLRKRLTFLSDARTQIKDIGNRVELFVETTLTP